MLNKQQTFRKCYIVIKRLAQMVIIRALEKEWAANIRKGKDVRLTGYKINSA